MELFELTQATDVAQAVGALANSASAERASDVRIIAGGTTLVDLMRLDVERPKRLLDINGLPLDQIEKTSDGGLKIGALVRNSDLAHHPVVQRDYAVLSHALLSGASVQLRNMATTGGNLLQRTRCVYFRDTNYACNKRVPGTGCSAINGYNRMLAILGTTESCVATNPSDMNVALTALEASIHIASASGTRVVAIKDFFLTPGNTPHRETVLESGELVTHVSLGAPVSGAKSVYLKLRDRASFEFALASAAVILQVDSGRVKYVRIGLGGVGTKPWRSFEAEDALTGKAVSEENFRAAAEAGLREAKPQSQNGFKVELAKRCITQTLGLASRMA